MSFRGERGTALSVADYVLSLSGVDVPYRGVPFGEGGATTHSREFSKNTGICAGAMPYRRYCRMTLYDAVCHIIQYMT